MDTARQQSEKIRLLRNCLATAEITYHLPDYPELLQSYIWQNTDLAPELPKLKKFLDFWTARLEGKLHSVTVSTRSFAGGRGLKHADASYMIH